MWLQQAGKSDMQCMKEYVLLVGQLDPHYNETVRGVATGEIREINFHKSEQSANPIQRQVPQPKPIDNTEYENTLNKSEKEIYDLFTDIAENKNEKKLLTLVKSGQLKVTD